MIPTLHISLLGDFRLVAGDIPVTTITLSRVQFLLAYLLLHRNAPQDRSRLAFLLWPDSTEVQAHTNLRKLVYQLRQAFPDVDTFLHADKQCLQWRPRHGDGSFTLDIQEVEQAFALAAQAEQAQDMITMWQALERVMQLYQGDLLPGCYEEWILPERDRLRQMFLSAMQRLIVLLEQERDYDSAITAALLLLRQDPLHEATYLQLMRLYALCGDRAAALRTYHSCTQILESELGVKPGEITRAVYTSLLQSDCSFEMRIGRNIKQRAEAPLQGRKAEWRHLQNIWNSATGGIASLQAGSSHLVILTGEAGIGKTRLARELEVWASRLGMATANARCYAALQNLAYAPISSWLRSDMFQASFSTLDATSLIEIARLVPEVLATQPHLSPPAAMTEGWQRQFFFAALARAVLSTQQPLLLLLDDLQWCDQETLEWLQYLFHFAPDVRLLLVGTVRVEETLPTHPLVGFLGALQRNGRVTEIPLGPLTLTETISLAKYIMGNQFDPATSNTLYQETEGNPLFVVEIVQASMVSKDTSAQLATQSSPPLLTSATSLLPPTVQAVLATRLAQLSAQAHIVANVAAVIGHDFSCAVLVHASGEREEHVVQGLDELWQRRMVREHDAGASNTYDFSHDKLREQIYVSLSPARRRFLHQRIAEAFEAVYVEDRDAVCGQIAAHYEQAGLLSQALPFYQQAGRVASGIYAHAEALHAFGRAADLLEAYLPGQARLSVPWQTVAQISVSLGDIFADIGSHGDARQAYQRAMTIIPPETHLWQARLYWKIGATWMYASTERYDRFYVNGCQAFEEADRLLTQITDLANPEWRAEWIALHFAQVWRGRRSVSEMATAIAKVQPIVEQYGTQEQRKFLAEAIGMHNAIRNRYVVPVDKVTAWRATVAVLKPTENEVQRGIDLAVLGIGLICASQFDEAEKQLRSALHVGECTGNAWLQNNCLMFLPFVFRPRGQVEEMRRVLAQVQSLVQYSDTDQRKREHLVPLSMPADTRNSTRTMPNTPSDFARGIGQNSHVFLGHYAWVAWRDGNLTLAETYGLESLREEQSQQIRPNPFLWAGRWPLIGVALAKSQTSVAINEVGLLFDPTQQPPREPLDALLVAVLQVWNAGGEEEAHTLLQQAIPLAEQMGYL